MADEVNSTEDETNCEETSEGKVKLESWLNKSMRVRMSDGRILVGMKFRCSCHLLTFQLF